MNAGAYGRDWRDVLVDAVVVDADGARTARRRRARALLPALGLAPGEVVARGRGSGSSRARPTEIKATVAELLAQRKATQPTNKRTFGSVFKNPSTSSAPGG